MYKGDRVRWETTKGNVMRGELVAFVPRGTPIKVPKLYAGADKRAIATDANSRSDRVLIAVQSHLGFILYAPQQCRVRPDEAPV